MTLPTAIAERSPHHNLWSEIIDEAVNDPMWQESGVERGFSYLDVSRDPVSTSTNIVVPGLLTAFQWGTRPLVIEWGGQVSHDTPNKNVHLWMQHLGVDVCRAGMWCSSIDGLYDIYGYLRFGPVPAPGLAGNVQLKLVNFDGGGNATLLPGAWISVVEV